MAKQGQQHVYLVGIMGCGKSSVGRHLAQQLGVPFVDLDEWIVEKEGRDSVTDIFETEGEAHWRRLECKWLTELSSQKKRMVIATGGGTVLQKENVRRMRRTGVVVWLDRPLDEIMGSIDTSKRPLLKDGKDKLEEIFAQRKGLYSKAANIRFVNKYNNAKRAAELLQRQLQRRELRLAEAARRRWKEKRAKMQKGKHTLDKAYTKRRENETPDDMEKKDASI